MHQAVLLHWSYSEVKPPKVSGYHRVGCILLFHLVDVPRCEKRTLLIAKGHWHLALQALVSLIHQPGPQNTWFWPSSQVCSINCLVTWSKSPRLPTQSFFPVDGHGPFRRPNVYSPLPFLCPWLTFRSHLQVLCLWILWTNTFRNSFWPAGTAILFDQQPPEKEGW